MPLAMHVESLDSLDESARAFYKETEDGKFTLDLEGYEDPKGLKSALEKERQAAKDASKQVRELQRRYDGIDPEKVKSLLSKLENDEEAKLLAEGKLNEVVDRRIEKQRAEYERIVNESKTMAQREAEKAKKFEQRVLDNHIRAAAAKAGLHSHAVEDALFRARTIFSLNEEGEAVQFRGDEVVMSKDGKTAFNPGEWLEEMKETAPHWFPANNSGGGAGGNSNTKGNRRTITRAQFEAMPASERSSVLKSGVMLTD